MGRKTKKEPKKTKKEPKKTRKNAVQKFKKLNCSPKKSLEFSCYSAKMLNKLKHSWNKRHPDKIITTNDTKEIWLQLKNNMKNICYTERCWLNQKFMEYNLDTELKTNIFAPDSPKSWEDNPNEWLSSIDIDNIMVQYENKHPSFIFIGPSPIDFNKKKRFGGCVWNELCNFNLNNLIKKGKNKIGIVFNTDPHNLGGSHWICMFIDVKKQYIFYFDSNASKTPKEIYTLVKKIKSQGDAIGINLKYIKNQTVHQKSNTECGMYCLFTLIQLLENKMEPDDFKKRIPDKNMENLRKVIFN